MRAEYRNRQPTEKPFVSLETCQPEDSPASDRAKYKKRTKFNHYKNMKIKFAHVTVSKSRKSFVLQATTKPHGDSAGSRNWKVKAELALGTSPRLLAEQAAKLGYTLFGAPSDKSRYAMKGKGVADWNGQIVGQYPEALIA